MTFRVKADLRRGLCGSCGHECAVRPDGTAYPHKERRVGGAVGAPTVYASTDQCTGDQVLAEPIEVGR